MGLVGVGRPIGGRLARKARIGSGIATKWRKRASRENQIPENTVSTRNAGWDVDKIVQILPQLPQQQQTLIQSLLNERGKAQIDELLKPLSARQPVTKTLSHNERVPQELDEDDATAELDLHTELETESDQLHTQTTSASEYLAVCESLESMVQLAQQDLETDHTGSSSSTDQPVFDRALWRSVLEFSQLECPQGEGIAPPFGLIVQIFELAKLQRGQRRRYRCIKLAGDMLYGFNQVRMDPYNEVEYLDALAFLGHTKRALRLWSSRQNKPDVENSIYWLEVGIVYHQQALQLAKAEILAKQMQTQFNTIQPRVILGFLHAYMHMADQTQFAKWAGELQHQLNTQGLESKDSRAISAKKASHLSQKSAEKLLNRPKRLTPDDLRDAVAICLRAQAWDSSAQLIAAMNKYNISPDKKDMLQMLEATTKQMFEPQQSRQLARLKGEKRRSAISQKNTQLNAFISQLVAAHPEVLEDTQFYTSWMRGLAGLQLYENAQELLNLLVARGVPLTQQILSTLVRAFLSRDKVDLAFGLLNKMENEEQPSSPTKAATTTTTTTTKYPRPNASIYALFLQYGARRCDAEFVTGILERMNQHGVRHSPASINTLLYYYYRQKDFQSAFDIYQLALDREVELSHVNFRTLWLIIRDYYRTFTDFRGPDTPQSPHAPDVRRLFASMVSSTNFKLSLNVYEYAIQATLLSGDVEGAAIILCYMDSVHNIKVPALLALSTLHLANRMQRKSSYNFAKPAKRETIVEPGYTGDRQSEAPPVAWQAVASRMGQTLEVEIDLDQVQQQVEAIVNTK